MDRFELERLLVNLVCWEGFTPDTEGAVRAIRELMAENERLREEIQAYIKGD